MDFITFIIMDVVLIVSYVIFYNIYKKFNMTKWINRNWNRALIVFSVTFFVSMIGIIVMSKYIADPKSQFIYGGALLGISAGMLPHIYLSFKTR